MPSAVIFIAYNVKCIRVIKGKQLDAEYGKNTKPNSTPQH